MQQTSRHLPLFLPLILAGTMLMLIFGAPAAAHADDSQVTVGVGDTTLTINGQTSPGTFVTVLKDTSPIGSTTADSAGNFTLTLTFNNGGINQLSLFGRTPDGALTDPLTASINVVDFQNTLYYAFLPPTIGLDSTSVMIGQNVRASGETIPNGNITMTTDTGTVVQATADSLGKWSATLLASSAGLHSLFAVAHDTIGRQSPSTRNLSFIVTGGGVAPVPPIPIPPIGTIASPPPVVPIITSPQDNQYLNSRTVVARGSAEQGILVEVWLDGHIVGSAYATAGNVWQVPFTLSSSHSVLQARTCRFGTCSDFSPAVNIYFNAGFTSGSLYSTLEAPSYELSEIIGQQVSLPLLIQNGAAPYEVAVDWGDHATDNKIFQSAGEYTLLHTYTAPGLYNGTVTVSDANHIKDVHHFAVRISNRPSPSVVSPVTTVLAATAGALLVFSVARNVIIRRRSK